MVKVTTTEELDNFLSKGEKKLVGSSKGSYISDYDSFTINYSSILSSLIKVAGTCCDSYASDLFIDWNAIKLKLDSGKMRSEKIFFGFRDSGIDGKDFIVGRLTTICNASSDYYYKKMFVLDIEVTMRKSNEKIPDNIAMNLYEYNIEKLKEIMKDKKTSSDLLDECLNK